MSDVEKDDPERHELVDWIVGALDDLPQTIGEQGYRALAWFFDDEPVVKVFTDDPEVSCEVNLDACAYYPSYASIPIYCWQTDIPCFVVWDGQRFMIDMRPVG